MPQHVNPYKLPVSDDPRYAEILAKREWVSKTIMVAITQDKELVKKWRKQNPGLKPAPQFKIRVEGATPLTRLEFERFIQQLYSTLAPCFGVDISTPPAANQPNQ